MTRVAWITDPHFNFVTAERFDRFVSEINRSGAERVLIGGDIGEADSFADFLRTLAARLHCPIDFVLGNHDYYRGSIPRVRETARQLSREIEPLNWLPDAGVIAISETTSLVGHGGWGDGRIGNFLSSRVILNDYLLIDELRDAHRCEHPAPETILVPALQSRLAALGDEAAASLRRPLEEALRHSERVLVLTHVPPYREACWHEGNLSDENWSPHFTCWAVGALLSEVMTQHPDQTMTVLCGHTHGAGRARIMDNLEVITGGAVYREPEIQRVWEIE
jgi:3',5'-cyclic-AMP phosphodiesterase